MAISERLFEELAKAKAQPSGAYRAAAAGIGAANDTLGGYIKGQEIGDAERKRNLEQQTLSEALGGLPPQQGIMNLTGESGAAQHGNLAALAALLKAKKEANQKSTQLFGTRGNKGLIFDPNETSIREIPIPPGSDEPIIPKAVTPTLTPYVDPGTGSPVVYTPGRGTSTAPRISGSGAPVVKSGNEQATGDVALMLAQAPNVDKLFNAYDAKGPIMSRLQATAAGNVLDPEAKQLEKALQLTAFSFGGKNLTENEKAVVFGAFFPSVTDTPDSRNQKRHLLKDIFTNKADLLQAADVLGPAGAPAAALLRSKLNQPDATQQAPQAFGGAKVPSFGSEQEANASGYKGPAMIGGRKAVIH